MFSETVQGGLALKDKTCTGCYACQNICPVDAIKMNLDNHGFCVSVINTSKCTSCGKCAKICPQLNPVFDNDPSPKCYAVKAEGSILETSSSGGAFSLLSDAVMSQGGYVCGPVYDSDMNVVFKMTNNRNELKNMQGSKYAFSELRNIYKDIKEKLDSNKLVMFTGCPCQVAGVKNFIGKNDNLITVDLICGGLPSKGIFQQYLKEISGNKKIVDIQFRSKNHPFGTAVMKFKDGSEEVRNQDLYFLSFLTDLIKSDACANCTFADTPRQGDISIGDLWKANEIITDTDVSRGMSCVMVNNDIGKAFFDKSMGNAAYCVEIPLPFLKQNNRLQHIRPPHLARQRLFFMMERKHSLVKSMVYALSWKFDVGITGFWRANNYGGILTYYALYKLVMDLGLEPLMIEARYNMGPETTPSSPDIMKSRYPYYHVSRYHNDLADEAELNNRVSKFIVGSDQVWNRNLISQMALECYTFDFADPSKKMVSIAPSFGSDHLAGGTKEERETFVKLLQRFSNISVRETSGVELCNSYGMDATRILDPVLLCDKKHYMDMISLSPAQFPEKYVFYYTANVMDTKIERLMRNNGYEVIKVDRNLDRARTKIPETPVMNIGTVENWVKCLHDSSFVVSDSFYATALAILFRKPFISLYGDMTSDSGLDCLTTLTEILGLNDRLFKNTGDVRAEDVKNPIDYERVHASLSDERERSLRWICDALSDKPA